MPFRQKPVCYTLYYYCFAIPTSLQYTFPPPSDQRVCVSRSWSGTLSAVASTTATQSIRVPPEANAATPSKKRPSSSATPVPHIPNVGQSTAQVLISTLTRIPDTQAGVGTASVDGENCRPSTNPSTAEIPTPAPSHQPHGTQLQQSTTPGPPPHLRPSPHHRPTPKNGPTISGRMDQPDDIAASASRTAADRDPSLLPSHRDRACQQATGVAACAMAAARSRVMGSWTAAIGGD